MKRQQSYTTTPFAFLIVCVVSILLVACGEEPEHQEHRLVVEGQIESDRTASVLLSWSVVPHEDGAILDKIIKWGKITISDGESEEILAGSPAQGWYPPYRYYGLSMRGKPGKVYTLRVEYKGQIAVSSVRMPSPTPISSIETKAVEGNDTLKSAVLHFLSPPDCPAYYYLSMRKLKAGEQPLPCYLGTVAVSLSGQDVSIGIFNPKTIKDLHYVPNLRVGESYEVSLNRVSEEVYRFRRGFNDAVAFGHNPFLATDVGLEGNVNGGLGVWSAQGTSRYELIL